MRLKPNERLKAAFAISMIKPTKESRMRNREKTPHPAVFLDRDGTIIEDRGDLFRPSQIVFFRNTISSLRRLYECFDLFIITNQSGVAKGAISIQDVEVVNSHIISHLAESGVRIVETYVCPHDRSNAIYILSGHGIKHREEISRETVVADGIREAAEIILERVNNIKG